MVAGISIYGGYDSGNLWSRAAANDSQIVGGTTAVTGTNINKETHLELVSVKSADGTSPGQSSYGVFIVNSSGPVILGQLKVNSGIGANGAFADDPADVITPAAADAPAGKTAARAADATAGPGSGGVNTCNGAGVSGWQGRQRQLGWRWWQ